MRVADPVRCQDPTVRLMARAPASVATPVALVTLPDNAETVSETPVRDIPLPRSRLPSAIGPVPPASSPSRAGTSHPMTPSSGDPAT